MSDFNPDNLPYVNPKIDRRVALITGGSSGIGWYTVLHLFLHGYVIYIAGKSKTRVFKAISDIAEEAEIIRLAYSDEQKNSERFVGEIYFIEIDLADLESVSRAIDTFKSNEDSLHLLVNNAGIMGLPYGLTKDGFEIQMQTNYIAHFLLVIELLPLLDRTADMYAANDGPRIVYVSSIGHFFIFRYFDLNSGFNYWTNIFFTWFRYGLAKTCGIHFMKMIALRNPKILCTSVHPGFVMNTNLFSYWTRLPIIGIVFWCFFQIFGFFFGVSNVQGAYATLRCCLDPKLSLEKDNGKYYTTNGIEASPSRVASNMNFAARTWIWTVRELNSRGIKVLSA